MSEYKFTRMQKSKGVYGWRLDGKPADPEWCYSFYIPSGKSLHVTVGEDHDFDLDDIEPVDLAIELERIHSRYIISPCLERIRAIIPDLEARKKEDFINRRKAQIEKLSKELRGLEHEIAEMEEEGEAV